MYAKYSFKNGKSLSVYLTDDILNNKYLRISTGAYELTQEGIRIGDEIEIYIKIDENKELFFEYEGEKRFFKDYEYISVDQLIEFINSTDEKWKIFDDDILATFLKDTENVGLVCKLKEFDLIASSLLGIGVTGSNSKEIECLCVPTEKKYKKNEWTYKITIEAEDENLRKYYAGETYYFSDFVSLIKDGIIKIVNKNNYKLSQTTLKRNKRTRK